MTCFTISHCHVPWSLAIVLNYYKISTLQIMKWLKEVIGLGKYYHWLMLWLKMISKHFFTGPRYHKIDETVVPWRGSLIFRHYIPNKTHKYWIKLFKLCLTKGYMQLIKIYFGPETSRARQIGLAQNVCGELAEKLLNEGCILYEDNSYTSFKLVLKFLSLKTHVVGTVQHNKVYAKRCYVPSTKKRWNGVTRRWQCSVNGIVILKWKDVQNIRILLTKHAPIMGPVQIHLLVTAIL